MIKKREKKEKEGMFFMKNKFMEVHAQEGERVISVYE